MNAKGWLLVLASLTLLFSLGLVAEAENIKITHYSYSGHGTEWGDYLKTMAEQFKEETGITVEILITAKSSEWEPKLASMLAGGIAPDVTDGNAKAGPFIEQGVFEDLKPYIDRDHAPINSMPPSAIEGSIAPNGEMWNIPVSIHPMVTYFNADMFSNLGMENPRQLGEGWNWDMLLISAKRLTSDLNADGKTDRWGTYRLNWRWDQPVRQAGGRPFDRIVLPSKSYFDSPESIKGWEFLQQLIAIEGVNSASSRASVWNEKAAMTFAYGPAVLQTYLSKVDFNWDIARQPKGPASRAARVGPTGFQILSASKQKEAAWQWIKFLVADPDRQLTMAKITGRIPSLREAMLQFPKAAMVLPDNWMAFIDTAFDPESYTPYTLPKPEMQAAIDATMKKLWNNEMAPRPALEQLQEQMESLFDKK